MQKLQAALVYEYKKEAIGLDVSEENMHLYVPTFESKEQDNNEVSVYDVKEFMGEANKLIEGHKEKT